MTDAPERIWLQTDGDYAGAYEAALGTDTGVTWCDTCINDDDDEYIRADLVARKDAALLAAEELAKAVGRNPRLIANLAFAAGTEENEGGSCRRQAQAIADYERRIAVMGAAVDAFRAAMEADQ